MNSTYTQGETITYTLDDASYSAAVLHVGATKYTLTKTDSVWSASIDTSSMQGRYRFAAIAGGVVRDSGAFYVMPLVSKYREVVEAIDAALQGVAANGKYSISVGEISMQDKTFDEMVKARNYYERLAEADETGTVANHGPVRIAEVYE